MNNKFRLLGTAFLTLLCASQAQAQGQERPLTDWKQFRDWSVTCNNVKTCTAFSVSARNNTTIPARPPQGMDNLPQGWMTIERRAGPSATPIVSISMTGGVDVASADRFAFVELVEADGNMLTGGRFSVSIGQRGAPQFTNAQSRLFLRQARQASHAVYYGGSGQAPSFFVSLSGLVASGRSLDATQGRTGSVGALIDVGTLPNSRVPAAPVAPFITAQPFVERTTRLGFANAERVRRESCGQAVITNPGGPIRAFDLGRRRVLWVVPNCEVTGSPSLTEVFIQTGNQDFFAPILSSPVRGEENDTNMIFPDKILTQSGLIRALYSSSPDQGYSETWAWNGRDLVRTSETLMYYRGGIPNAFWPSTYTSQVRTASIVQR